MSRSIWVKIKRTEFRIADVLRDGRVRVVEANIRKCVAHMTEGEESRFALELVRTGSHIEERDLPQDITKVCVREEGLNQCTQTKPRYKRKSPYLPRVDE